MPDTGTILVAKTQRSRRRTKPAALPVEMLPDDRLGRDICADIATAERREWLMTNGIGGYASGTAAG